MNKKEESELSYVQCFILNIYVDNFGVYYYFLPLTYTLFILFCGFINWIFSQKI